MMVNIKRAELLIRRCPATRIFVLGSTMLCYRNRRMAMAALPKLAPSRKTVEEFLDWPGDGSERKFQLIDGGPVAMTPARVTHGLANVVGLRNHLVGSRCYVVVSPGVIPRVRSEADLRISDVVVATRQMIRGAAR
jgi:hypothetical protein